MMVTDLRCWWQNHYVGDFLRFVGDFRNVLNRAHILSPTHLVSNIRHQHRCHLILTYQKHIFVSQIRHQYRCRGKKIVANPGSGSILGNIHIK